MRKKIVRRRRPLGLAALVLTAVAVAASALLLGGGSAAATDGVTCAPAEQQAEHRLQLNTVTLNPTTTDPLAKTVIMEKDIYECRTDADALMKMKDIETFIEIVERTATPSTPTIVTVDRRVEVATCDKSLNAGVVCSTKELTLGPTLTEPLGVCRPVSEFPPDVQMNTVALGNSLVKTIKVDKEVFVCNIGPTYADVYLITEILERVTAAKDNIKPYAKVFEGIVCYRTTYASAPDVASCNRFTTS